MDSIPTYDPAHARHECLRKSVIRKIDLHVLPGLSLLWLACFIDRTNVGNAKVGGMDRSLGLKGIQYNVGLAVFYVTYIASELPSNFLLKKMGGKIWLPFLVASWGIVTTFSAFMPNYGAFITVRLLLGLFEGGLLPGMVMYLSTMYKRNELQLRVGIFYASASLSGAFGGLLAYGIEQMAGVANLKGRVSAFTDFNLGTQSNYPEVVPQRHSETFFLSFAFQYYKMKIGWQWVFILEGIGTILIALFAFFYMPTDLSHASFLTQEERMFAVNRLKFFKPELSEVAQLASLSNSNKLNDHTSRGSIANDVIEFEERNRSFSHESPDDRDRHRSKGDESPPKIRPVQEDFELGEAVRGLKEPQVWFTGIGYMSLLVGLYSYSLFLPTIIVGMGYSGPRAQLFSSFPYLPASVLVVVVAFIGDRLQLRGPLILLLTPLTMLGYVISLTVDSHYARYLAVFLMSAGTYPSVPSILCIIPNNTAGMIKRSVATALQLMIANTSGFIATFIYRPDQSPSYRRGHSIALAFTALAWLMFAINCLYCWKANKARDSNKPDKALIEYVALVEAGRTRAPIGDRAPNFRFTI